MIALWILFISLVIISVMNIIGLCQSPAAVSIGSVATLCAIVSGTVIVGCHLFGHPIP